MRRLGSDRVSSHAESGNPASKLGVETTGSFRVDHEVPGVEHLAAKQAHHPTSRHGAGAVP